MTRADLSRYGQLFYRRLFSGTPQRVAIRCFGLLILLGTILLSLPGFARGEGLSLLDALFTATSAVCVTGLVVVDPGTSLTSLGLTVIMMLIQLGGLGVLTFTALAFDLMGYRLPLGSQGALDDSFFQRNVSGRFKLWFRRMVKVVAGVELAGAVCLLPIFWAREPFGHALFSAVFHAVSAFCNAGFSLYADSLCGVADNPLALGVIGLLIVLGGLGHIVLLELYEAALSYWRGERERRFRSYFSSRRFSYHTRLVLLTSALLIGGGALGLTLCGETGPPGVRGWLAGPLFFSVSARTAGFNAAPMTDLGLPAALILIILMLVGGSPGSCAGGIKTTTFALGLARLRAGLTGNEEVRLLGRQIPAELVGRTVALIGLALLWNYAGVMILALTEGEGVALKALLFEQISAFGTVGLSLGLTPHLSAAGKIWIILTMFVGRLGPLTLVLSFVTPARERVSYPTGKVMVG